jgi:beta-phosphoglucomutase-like phosphatase (HAD superfamily)
MAETPRILLFDIDGTLISTGGAGAVAWKQAFEELHGIPADIGQFTDAGMTDPDVGAQTFGRCSTAIRRRVRSRG